MRPLRKIPTIWTGDLAYVIGLIASDGNLSKNGRGMTFVSKDLQLIETFTNCLGIKPKICLKKSGFSPDKKSYFIQFTDINFYNFLQSIGLTPAKSKTIKALDVPDKYFFDFLRGSFDGDGSFYSYWDKRWASSFLFYLSFISASQKHIVWLRKKINDFTGVTGHAGKRLYGNKAYQLKYAKTDARVILERIYHSVHVPKLERKYKKVYSALTIDAEHARVL